ncbi:MAG: phosphomannomutase/phosphoglucomutase [Pseudomonadales bacterium]|nr:phosphomannomutase/phosphoglucomutase [Pseudomonadales bacterium]
MANNNSNEFMKLAAPALGGLVVALALSLAATAFWLQETVNKAHQDTLIGNKADEVGRIVDLEQRELIKQLESVAASTILTDIVRSGDLEAIAREEARLGNVIPGAIKVRLFGAGEAKVERDAQPPFTYTSLDLVNRAEAGLPVFPEAINTADGWILSVAAALSPSEGGGTFGTLFVYLQMDTITDGLYDGIPGEVRITQSFQNAPTNEILSFGSGGLAGSAVTRELENPNWQMQFLPNAALVSATAGTLLEFVVPLGVFVVFALLGVLMGVGKTRAAINADATRLSNQLTDVINDDFKPSTEYEFSTFVDVDANLVRVQRRVDEPRRATERVKSATPKAQPKREEMVDIEMIDEDDYEEQISRQAKEAEDRQAQLPGIFRAYDIRGVVNETLTTDVVKKIGLAIGSEAGAQGEQTLVVGADGRVSSPAILETLIEGIVESGRDVINIGQVPTPFLYFATQNTEATSGVMITGSHNPPEYNGFKIVLGGRTLVEHDIQELYQRFIAEDFSSGDGEVTDLDVRDDYIDAVSDDVVVAHPLKIIVDCANGIAGNVAPELFANLGCDVIPLYCEVDGTFPNHSPDPTVPENLDDLILMVKSQNADLGIAIDGDGDRVVAVSGSGEIIWPDRLLMLFAKDVVSLNPGSDVVYDVKCTRHINTVISGFGGRPIICRSGHSFVKQKMTETGALLGGELSGHICFSERWNGFDDGLYAACRLLEIVGASDEGLDQLLSEFPTSVTTPEIQIPVPEEQKFGLVRRFIEAGDFPDGTVTTTDGLRVDFSEGWGLIRASNTNPALTLRFEADDDTSLHKIKQLFKERLKSVDSSLDF